MFGVSTMKPWKWIAFFVGLIIAGVFSWDIIADPIVYFGYDPFPGIIYGTLVFIQIVLIAVGLLVLIGFGLLVLFRTVTFLLWAPLENDRDSSHLEFIEEEEPRRGWARDYPCEVVGESRYQEALDEICGGKDSEGHEEELTASLILDDGNSYDNKAVRIEIEGDTVGFLSRSNARKFRKRYATRKSPFRCEAIILGGWNRGRGDTGHYGVRLGLDL